MNANVKNVLNTAGEQFEASMRTARACLRSTAWCLALHGKDDEGFWWEMGVRLGKLSRRPVTAPLFCGAFELIEAHPVACDRLVELRFHPLQALGSFKDGGLNERNVSADDGDGFVSSRELLVGLLPESAGLFQDLSNELL